MATGLSEQLYKQKSPMIALWHLWRVTARDAAGRLEGELFGNGLNTKRVFDRYTGELTAIRTGVAGGFKRNITYQYNARGSVSQRRDVLKNIVETFQYDALDRLSHWRFNNPNGGDYDRDYHYDNQGNLTYKNNAGSYDYVRGTSNQLSSRVTPEGQTIDDYRYDANGNMTHGDGRSYQWTASNKVASVTTAAGVTRYQYDAGGSRVKKVEGDVTTYYFGRDYEMIVETDVLGRPIKRLRHHIFAGHELVATHEKTLRGEEETQLTDMTAYMHRDALGSVDTVTDAVGKIIQQQRYTPFGEAIPISKNNAYRAGEIRGYTSHENVGDTGLINMNARLYDPHIGRFIQADTLIPEPGDVQSYNRYAYVKNNPLKYNDPSGHFAQFLWGLGMYLFSMTTDDPFLQKVTGMAGMALMGANLPAVNGSIIQAAQNGATMSFIQGTAQGGFGAGIKQGMIGGLTAGLTTSVANDLGHSFTTKSVLGQMVLQGAISELRGGKFKHGAISALAGKVGGATGTYFFGAMGTGSQGDYFGRTAVSMMFGGLASEASGGSFEDGAMTALFVHLFNDRGRNRRTDKMIIYTFKGAGAHAAMEIANKDGTERILWDLNGDYNRHNRAELELFRGIAKGEYVSYWNKEGETVYVQTISIDEAEYFSLEDRIGGEIGFFDCAFSTSGVIAGLPRFKDLDWVFFPSSLRNYFENLNYPAVKHSPGIMND